MKEKSSFDYVYKHIHTYRLSEDMLKVGDHYYHFEIARLGKYPISRCDSEEMAKIINQHYANNPFSKRVSARVEATDDPALNKDGVPEL